MRRIHIAFLGLVLALLGATDAKAARFTPHLDALEAALQQRVADTATSPKLARVFNKALKKLGKTTTSLAADVKTAAKILPKIEKKAGTDAALMVTAQTTLDGLLAAVEAVLAKAQADADALTPKKQGALVLIGSLLSSAVQKLTIVQGTGTLTSRIVGLRKAVVYLFVAVQRIERIGGGSGPCGPPGETDGRRFLTQTESFTGAVVDNSPGGNGAYQFSAGSLVAKLILGGTRLEITAFDCGRSSSLRIQVDYPPTVNQTQNLLLGAAGIRFIWDGLEQISSATVVIKAFDPGTKSLEIEFSFASVNLGHAVIEDWD